MLIPWIFAAMHLLALGIGLGAIWARGRALRGTLDSAGQKRVFAADGWWGVAFGLWLVTGLTRAFGGLERGAGYYLHNHLFLTKMALLIVILVLEIRPMATLIRWRVDRKRGVPLDLRSARSLARVSDVQAVLVVLMLLAATAMARGIGAAAR